MANIVPGVVWQPIAIDYTKRAKRRKGRGLIGHVAVSTSKNLTPSPTGNSWTFYLPKYEPAIQYIDLDYVSGSSLVGDATCATFESEGGMGSDAQVNAEPWTENQLNWAARILRHLHDTEGTPLQVMPDSRPESRGFATHRLGVDPWRVSGGELWTKSRGKLCPGDAKHAQRYEVVRRASEGIFEEDDMFSDTDRWAVNNTMGAVGRIEQRAYALDYLLQKVVAEGANDLNEADVAAAIKKGVEAGSASVLALVRQTIVESLGKDNVAQADAIVEKLATRLAS